MSALSPFWPTGVAPHVGATPCSGDLVRVDEEGYFFLVDRLKRTINVNCFKVWPAECETTLYRHLAVQECCVVAVRASQRGETVKAFVVPKRGHASNTTALTDWARREMAAYKVPREVAFVESLPRTASNKVDWRRLQDEQTAP